MVFLPCFVIFSVQFTKKKNYQQQEIAVTILKLRGQKQLYLFVENNDALDGDDCVGGGGGGVIAVVAVSAVVLHLGNTAAAS